MRLTAVRDAARHRMARLRGAPAPGDDGFALVFVMLVSLVIMIGVTSVVTITASDIQPATHSADDEAALAAAQSGIQVYLAYLNADCTTFNSTPCDKIRRGPVSGVVPGTDGNRPERYTTTVLNAASYLTDGFLRVQSVGSAGSGTRTLVADFSGQPNLLRYAYLSKYETLGTSFLKSYFPARTVRIDKPTDVSAAGLTGAKTVTWSAPTSGAGLPGNVGICDELWYGSNGRAAAKTSYDATLPSGTDWSASGSEGTVYQPCEVTFTTGMTFNGPVYSDDALYLSYGTQGGAGPTFTVPPQETLPAAASAASATDPGLSSSALYRRFPGLGGGPSIDSTGYPDDTVQHAVNTLELPDNADGARAKATCVYTGPTRILLSGTTATITSPMTQAEASNPCYASTGAGGLIAQKVPETSTLTLADGGSKVNTAGADSVLQAKLDVTKALIYVADAKTAQTWPAATAGAIFHIGSGSAPAVPADPAPTATTPTYSPAALPWYSDFNREASSGPNWASYSGTRSGTTFQQWLNSLVSADPRTDIVTAISQALKPFDTTNGGNPSRGGDYRYGVDASPNVSTSKLDTPIPVPGAVTDPLLQATNGTATLTKATTTTTTSATVYKQTPKCTDWFFICWKWAWGNKTTQFTVNDTQAAVHYSQTFAPAEASFPVAKDVTRYPTWSSTGNAPWRRLYRRRHQGGAEPGRRGRHRRHRAAHHARRRPPRTPRREGLGLRRRGGSGRRQQRARLPPGALRRDTRRRHQHRILPERHHRPVRRGRPAGRVITSDGSFGSPPTRAAVLQHDDRVPGQLRQPELLRA